MWSCIQMTTSRSWTAAGVEAPTAQKDQLRDLIPERPHSQLTGRCLGLDSPWMRQSGDTWQMHKTPATWKLIKKLSRTAYIQKSTSRDKT